MKYIVIIQYLDYPDRIQRLPMKTKPVIGEVVEVGRGKGDLNSLVGEIVGFIEREK